MNYVADVSSQRETGQDMNENYYNKLEQKGFSPNVTSLIGHGTVRRQVMGGSFMRPPNTDELAAMRRTTIGFIFQAHNLLPVYSVYENILFPLILNGEKEVKARERVMEMIGLVDLEPLSGKRPTETPMVIATETNTNLHLNLSTC